MRREISCRDKSDTEESKEECKYKSLGRKGNYIAKDLISRAVRLVLSISFSSEILTR